MAEIDKTIIEIFAHKLRMLGEYNSNAEVAPSVILWPDADRRFEQSIDVLQNHIPELFVLASYDSKKRRGPAIWLRCAIAKTVPIESWGNNIPIIYLPGIGRSDFRPDSSDPLLKPLIPFQFSGRFFSQKSTKDITPYSFLANTADGIGLDIPEGAELRETLGHALPKIWIMRYSELQEKHIDVNFLNSIISGGDTISAILAYISSGEDSFGNDEVLRTSLRRLFLSKYSIDIDKDTPLSAAEMLANHKTYEWQLVWNRYEKTIDFYPSIENQIRKCTSAFISEPGKDIGWPQNNELMEGILLGKLKELRGKGSEEIFKEIYELNQTHSYRVDTIWGKKGQSQVARALAYLNKLREIIQNKSFGSSIDELKAYYTETGYKADLNMLLAIAETKDDEQTNCVKNLLISIYNPYVDDMTRIFQEAVKKEGYPYSYDTDKYKKDTCILFVDGLRFDIAKMVESSIRTVFGDDYELSEKLFWCPYPSVTSCGKYAVSPIRDELDGCVCDEYTPSFIESGKTINSTAFKKHMDERGWNIIEDASIKIGEFGWCSTRNIDEFGHLKQFDMPKQVHSFADEITSRVRELLDAGWKHVNIVTDHGWLIIPGKFPKCELPNNMTYSNGGRCAQVKETVPCKYQQVPWSWNTDYYVAAARGVGSFIDGKEYAHGGLSIQECLTLQLNISSKQDSISLDITGISWKGMACSFDIDGNISRIKADMRISPGAPMTSVLEANKKPDLDGHVRLLVTGEDIEGRDAFIVLLNDSDSVVFQKRIVIGG